MTGTFIELSKSEIHFKFFWIHLFWSLAVDAFRKHEILLLILALIAGLASLIRSSKRLNSLRLAVALNHLFLNNIFLEFYFAATA